MLFIFYHLVLSFPFDFIGYRLREAEDCLCIYRKERICTRIVGRAITYLVQVTIVTKTIMHSHRLIKPTIEVYAIYIVIFHYSFSCL